MVLEYILNKKNSKNKFKGHGTNKVPWLFIYVEYKLYIIRFNNYYIDIHI